MKFLELIGWTKPKSKRSITWDDAYRGGLVNTPTRSGVHVNEHTALTQSVLFLGSRVISEAVGGMPLKLYRKGSAGRTEADDHPLWPILTSEPNPEMGEVEFKTLLQFWAVLYGNAYAEIERAESGEVIGLHPVHPTQLRPNRTEDGSLVYEVAGSEGQFIPAADVIHLKGPTDEGASGFELVKLARESIGFSIACDRFGASFFGNAARPSGVLSTAGVLSDAARENLRTSFNKLHGGVEKTGTVAVLEEGLTFAPMQITNEAGEYDKTRQFQVYEMCRWIGVDPIFVYEYGRATWDNGTLQLNNFLQFSLNSWLLKWESEISRKCLSKEDRKTLYPEFTREAIIRMDPDTQSQIWERGVKNGWYDPQIDIRPWLNLSALPKKPEPVELNQPQQVAESDGTQINPQ